MLTLIAESKTMTPCDLPVSRGEFDANMPLGEEAAGMIMAEIARMTAPELAVAAKFSQAMAAKAISLAYDFPDKSIGQKAIEAFTGVVFRSFGYGSLDPLARKMTSETVRIVSSLYGWLRPDDIVKAYRLDYTTPLAPGDETMVKYWKKDVTIALVRDIKERAGESVLNLLPADASKAVDWKLVKHFAKVWKVDFKELRDGGGWRTPTSNRLKELRGHLLREIVTRSIEDPRDLLTLETDHLLPLGTPDYPDHIAFCV